jgi:hypothetical protein
MSAGCSKADGNGGCGVCMRSLSLSSGWTDSTWDD